MKEFEFKPNVDNLEKENILEELKNLNIKLNEIIVMLDEVKDQHNQVLSLKDTDFLKMIEKFKIDINKEKDNIQMKINQKSSSISSNISIN